MKDIKFTTFYLSMMVLFFIGLAILLKPASDYSENENRTLKTLNKYNVSDIMEGVFQEDLANFLCDQFPKRDAAMAVSACIKTMLGKRDMQDTYIGENHYYFEKVTDDDINVENYKRNLGRLNALCENRDALSMTVMLVPSSGVILSDCLPAFASIYDADALYDMAELMLEGTMINPSEALRAAHARGEYIYYRTDHHWTTYGAYIGYTCLMEDGAYTDYNPTSVCDDFLGTLHSRVLLSDAKCDEVFIATEDAAVSIDGQSSTLYHMDALGVKDKYQVFLGGNYGLVELEGQGNGTLLILKDSFANCFVPYLLSDYERIIMVDMRFYPASVANLIDTENITDVLVLYELNNFANDKNLAKLTM
ncbi:MAG: hypothetical protein K6F92_09320 [Lachnospiraceae bacterium]|nr:hypothetical protein [Lachnospiraceae bacterium]